MPIFDETPTPPRTGHEYGKERDLMEQICFAYRNLVNRVEAIGDDVADEIILAGQDGDSDKVKYLSTVAGALRDAHSKNVKLKTKMEAQGLGH
jgi:hypothetical protein